MSKKDSSDRDDGHFTELKSCGLRKEREER